MRLAKFSLVTILGILIIMALVNAESRVLPSRENKQKCIDSGGEWLMIIYSAFFSTKSPETYCQCSKTEFIRITYLQNWTGCEDRQFILNENQFIDDLKQKLNGASRVEGTVSDIYIEIVEKTITLKKIHNYGISALVVATIVWLFLRRRSRKQLKK